MPNAYDFTEHYKTRKSRDVPHEYRYLTCSCYHRQSFLSKDRPRLWLTNSIIEARNKFHFKLIAWVFMPEHIHLLILPTQPPYDMAPILSAVKQPVARAARKHLEQSAPTFLNNMQDSRGIFHFWQRGGGYDRNLFSPEELWEKIHYIHNNPVRRKLVPRPTDWPWSSAADYAKIRTGPLPLDNQNLPWTK